MADERGRPADDEFDGSGDLGEEALGAPIDELRGYQETPSSGFLPRVLGSVRRRTLTSHLATLGWSALGQVLLTLLDMIHSMLAPREPERRE